jgi:membrane associated rhomboid family serine protease
VLGAFVVVIWVIELVDAIVLGGTLDEWGIRPRMREGLPGIVLAPFLHGSVSHVAANTMPFLVLAWLVLLRGWGELIKVSILTVAFSGLVVWLIGRSSTVHLGASSLIFGYLGYLILRGYFDRSAFSVLISILVGLFYGSLIWGVLPTDQEQSWEGHLGGFLAGVCCAWLLTRQPRTVLQIRL